jgi:uncharacterized Zn-finger protein
LFTHEKKKDFKCKLCEKSYIQKQQLNWHIGSVHEGIKPFSCSICNRGFDRNQNLKTHIESVHEGKNSICPSCNKGFTQAVSLKRHILCVHEKKKPFKCDVCQASFGLNGDLKGYPFEEAHF